MGDPVAFLARSDECNRCTNATLLAFSCLSQHGHRCLWEERGVTLIRNDPSILSNELPRLHKRSAARLHTYKDGDLSYEESAPKGLTASPSDVEISAVNKEGTCEYTAKPGLLTWGRETKPTTLWSIKSLKPVSAAEHDAVMSDFKQIKSAWNSASQLGSDEKTRFHSLIKSGQLKEAGEMLDAKANSVFTADGQKFSDQGWSMCLTRTVENSKGHESRATTKLNPSRGSSAPSSADT